MWQRVVRSPWFWCATVVVVIIVSGVAFTISCWDWLHDGDVSPSATIRNMGLVIGGLAAGFMAVWRLAVVHKQAETQEEEARVTGRGLLDARYRSGMEMLHSNNFAIRIVGIHELAQLATEQPDEMHTMVLTAFCNFVRNQSVDQGWGDVVADFSPKSPIGSDIQAIMDTIGGRSERQIKLEKDKKIKLNLRGVNLHGCMLTGSNLNDAILSGADLSGVRFIDVELSQTDLWRVDLTGAALIRVDLSNSNFCGVNVSGTEFRNVKGFTQEDLDRTIAAPDQPPFIGDVEDPYTGEQVVWKGRHERQQD